MTLEDLQKWFLKDPWVSTVIGLFALLGIPLTIFLYIRGTRIKRPCYAVRSNNLVRGSLNDYPDVQISYANYQGVVENVTVAKVLFYNRGRLAIRRTDILKTMPIQIQLREGCIILGVRILASNEHNRVSITRSVDRKRATMTFHHLDHTDGAVFELIHTGTSHEDVTVIGKVIEGGTPRRHKVVYRPRRSLILGMLVGLTTASAYDRMNKEAISTLETISLVVAITAGLIITIWKIWDCFGFKTPGPFGRYRWLKPFWD